MPYIDREMRCQACAGYRQRNLEKERERSQVNNKRNRAELANTYICQLLRHGTGLKRKDIPAELIEAKRLQLQLKRLAKTKGEENA